MEIDVNGQREENNNYLIDGVSVTDLRDSELAATPLPSPEAVQEFKVQTSLYDATQGRDGGGNINAVLKSGSPKWHGSAFEFFRNDTLNANEFFQNREGQPRPDVKQNVFGGALGGPIGHDGKGGFFFVSYQSTRQESGLSPGAIISIVLPVILTDRSAASLSTAAFGNPNEPIDPVVLALLNAKGNAFGGAGGGWLIPSLPASDPANPAAGALFNISKPGEFNEDQFVTNYDREFADGRDKLVARYFFSNSQTFLPFGGGAVPSAPGQFLTFGNLSFPLSVPVRDHFLSAGETHVISPRVLNEFRFGLLDLRLYTLNQDPVTASQLGINRPTNNVTNDSYQFQVLGTTIGPSATANTGQAEHNYTWEDTVSYSLGRHFLRFGGLYTHSGTAANFPEDFNGILIFNSFQDFLLGAPAYAFGGSGVSNHRFVLNDYALYTQDDYKLTANLTLNLGARWDLMSAPVDALHHSANVIPGLLTQGLDPFVVPRGVNSLGIPGLLGTTNDSGRANNYASNWGPRVGLAYDLFGRHDTSLRAGYAIYYERDSLATAELLASQSPFSPTTTVFAAPGHLSTLFEGLLPAGGAVDASSVPQPSQLLGFIDPTTGLPTANPNMLPIFSGTTASLAALSTPQHYVSPSTQQWNLTVQHSIPRGWVFEIGYVGSKGTHLAALMDPLQAQLASPQHPFDVTDAFGNTYTITQKTALNVEVRSPVLGMNPRSFFYFSNAANSKYNSLQATVSHRFAKNFYFQGAYTLSKSMDPVLTTGAGAYQYALNDQTNLAGSEAVSDFDRPKRLVVSYHYDSPFFSDAHGWQGALLSHWFVSGITTFQSGLPFRVTDSAGGSAYGDAIPDLATPNLAPGFTPATAYTTGSLGDRLTAYLNRNAFLPDAALGVDGSTGFGDLGRNVFRAPFQQNWDASIGNSGP